MKEDITVLRNYKVNGKIYNFWAVGDFGDHYHWIVAGELEGRTFKKVTDREFDSLNDAINYVKEIM